MAASDLTSVPVDALYQEHRSWLATWLRRKLGNPWDAADLLHDTFVRVMASRLAVRPGESRALLTHIAKGLVIDLHRRRQLEAAYLEALALLPPSLAPSPEERALVVETLVAIEAALDKLPEKVRDTFLLSQFDGLTYSAIAERQGLSVGAVRKHMLKAAQACHAALASTGSAP